MSSPIFCRKFIRRYYRGSINRCLAVTSLFFSIPALNAAFIQDSGADGIVSIQAESFNNNIPRGSHSWVLRNSPSGFDGSGFMRSEPDTGANITSNITTTSPELVYNVNFTKTGTHYVWIRGLKTGGNDDSLHFGLNGVQPASANAISNFGTNNAWNWTKSRSGGTATINVTSTGLQTIHIWMREDGMRVDKIVLTTSSTYTPTGAGPAESPTTSGQSPYGGSAWAIPGRIEAENYDLGGSGVAYNDTTNGNSGGAYRTDDVDIQNTSDTGGGYNIGWIANNEWLEYTVNVAQSGTYNITARVASQSSGGSLRIEMNGVNVSGTMSFSATGGWQNWTNVTATGVSLNAGQQVMRIAMQSANFNLNYVDFALAGGPVNQAPVVFAGNPQTITLPNTAFINATVTDDGLPNGTLTYQWTKVSGPGTVNFVSPTSEDTGVSFSAAGSYVLRLTASDGALNSNDTVAFTVNPAPVGAFNPVTDFYPGEFAWTDDINWGNEVSILSYGGSGNGTTDNLAAFNAARDAVSGSGGGVVYFPAGTYYFSDTILLKDGVVLLGVEPSVTDAKNVNFNPPSKLVFPQYIPTFTGSGTPNSTAFKKIRTTNPATDSNIGLVWLDVNRAGIELDPPDPVTAVNVNHLIFGIRSNNVATPEPQVPTAIQNAWQRYSYRFSYNVKLQAYENAAVLNSRFNDNITDNFNYANYIVNNAGTPQNLTDGKVSFSYTNHYVISVGRSGGPFPIAATPDTAPSLFREGNVIRDNYVYNTMRVGIIAAGQGLVVKDNIRRDQQNKTWWTDPTGRNIASNSQTLENRAIDVSGYDVVVDGNDYRVYRHFLKTGPYYSVDGEGILTQECCGGTLIRGIDIINNVGNTYIGLYKMRDIDDAYIANNEFIGSVPLGIFVMADTNNQVYKITNSAVQNNIVGANEIIFRGNAPGGVNNFVTGNQGTGNIKWACETNATISGNSNMVVQPCE